VEDWLVSPGAATDGVKYFFIEKLTTFLVITLCSKVMTFLAVVLSQSHPLDGVTP